MKRFAVLLPALCAAAACHHAPSVSADNASANEVAAKVAASGASGPSLSPGQYAMTYAVTKVDMPNMPAAAQGMMDQMKKGVTSSICVTPEQAAKPAASMFAGQGAQNCTYDHFSMSAGAMDATTTCHVGPTTATSTMKGQFAADHFHIDVTSDAKGAMGNVTTSATIDAKRTGDCGKTS